MFLGVNKLDKAIVIVSGGMDSAVLVYDYKRHYEVKALSVDYGQRHRKELIFARRLCGDLGIEHRTANLRDLSQFLKGSSQTDPDVEVPLGHYEEESMKLTVVPNRNMIMLSVAVAWAISEGSKIVAYGAHAGDHAIYPDCRPSFY